MEGGCTGCGRAHLGGSFEQFVADPADQLLRTVYLMGQGRSHTEYIYARINASTRAAPGAFSMQHGLLPKEGLSRAPPRLRR